MRVSGERGLSISKYRLPGPRKAKHVVLGSNSTHFKFSELYKSINFFCLLKMTRIPPRLGLTTIPTIGRRPRPHPPEFSRESSEPTKEW